MSKDETASKIAQRWLDEKLVSVGGHSKSGKLIPFEFFDESNDLKRKHLNAMKKDMLKLAEKAGKALESYGFRTLRSGAYIDHSGDPVYTLEIKTLDPDENLSKREAQDLFNEILGYGWNVSGGNGKFSAIFEDESW